MEIAARRRRAAHPHLSSLELTLRTSSSAVRGLALLAMREERGAMRSRVLMACVKKWGKQNSGFP